MWAGRLSMMTISPFESVGTRQVSTQSSKRAALIGAIEDYGRDEPAEAQPGDQRDRLLMAVRHSGAQPSPSLAASGFSGQIGRGAGVSRPKGFHAPYSDKF